MQHVEPNCFELFSFCVTTNDSNLVQVENIFAIGPKIFESLAIVDVFYRSLE